MKMMDHDMSGMGGMQHGQMMPPAPVAGPALPEGAPLRELPRLANMATDGGRFETKLTAGPAKMRFANGLDTPILAYNGESPGPMIEVIEGDRVRIAFRNAIPNQASTIHWHGMPVPADRTAIRWLQSRAVMAGSMNSRCRRGAPLLTGTTRIRAG